MLPRATNVSELDAGRWQAIGNPDWQHKAGVRLFQVLHGAVDFRFGRHRGMVSTRRRLIGGEVWLLAPGWRLAIAEPGARWRYANLSGWQTGGDALRPCLLPPRETALLDGLLSFAAARRLPRGHSALVLIGELVAESQAAPAQADDGDRHLLALAAEVAADPTICSDIDDLRRRAGCSSAWLRRRWPHLTGQRPAAWLRSLRMRLARDLLADGMACSEVAERIGLGDPRSLRRQFHQVYGCAPSRFRIELGPHGG